MDAPLQIAEPSVIVVEDDDAVRESLQIMFEACGHPVRAFVSIEAFLAAARDLQGCVLLDLHLGSDSVADLLVRLENRAWTQPTVVLSGGADGPTRNRALMAGAVAVLDKPVDPRHLIEAVKAALAAAR